MGFMDDINNEELLEENIYIEDAKKGLGLISKLQSVNENISEIEKKFNYLEKLLEEDYLELVNKSSYPEEAKAYKEIVKTQKKIEEMIKFSFLANKHIVAVGGGFSSGKSKFINSLVGKETLPTDTKPTTSIPTFLAKGEKDRIYPYNIFGNKTEIDQEALQAITHAFHEKYKLSFTKILKSVNLQFKGMPYENIIFLDTPGYTKSDYQKQASNTDKEVAKKHLQVADYLIWIVDINQGTIPKEDLDFINDLKFDKDILIILNKADTKIKDEIKDIIKVTKSNVKRAGINTVGVTAYSSLEKKIYFKDELNSFLDEIEKNKKKTDLLNSYNKVFDNYINYHEEIVENERNKLSNFNRFYLLSSESEDNIKFVDELISESKKKIKRQKNILKDIKELKEDYIDEVKIILEDMNIDYQKKNQNYSGIKTYKPSKKINQIEKIESDNSKWYNPLSSGKTINDKYTDSDGNIKTFFINELVESVLDQSKEKKVIKYLNAGADVNILDANGNNALMNYLGKMGWGASFNKEIFMELVKRTNDINLKNKFNQTALIRLSSLKLSSKIDINYIVGTLVDFGANLDIMEGKSYTSLMYATMNQSVELIIALLYNGANPNIKNKDGETALSLSFNDKISRLLRKNWARGKDMNNTLSDLKNKISDINDLYNN